MTAYATVNIDIGSGEATGGMSALDLLFIMAFLALIPSLLLLMTSFTRIIIVLSLLRNALGTQSSPPNQIITGLALFLTLFIMMPVLDEVNETAYQPFRDEQITQEEALDIGVIPFKRFMLIQMNEDDLDLFMSIAEDAGQINKEDYTTQESLLDLRLNVIVPAFVISELKRAFMMGFFLYIPFLILDIVVSSTLMSMGMVMLPPSMISLPFKLMMFILVDGWSLLVEALISSFHISSFW
ncbi:MAG: flagellar type III secretion system pore protein FliP [Oscillospiraceae bacterium]|nr:flagellar type III secretion system pore protein FliP [Oscillospiraceae bacterium]